MNKETQLTLHKLSIEINTALDKGDIEKFAHLIGKRSLIISNIFGNGLKMLNSGSLVESEQVLMRLTAENKKWIPKSRLLMSKVRDQIDNVQTRKKADKNISRTYRKSASPGRFIARQG